MRGTLLVMLAVSVAMGIIPAYAGNTNDRNLTLSACGDHPRVCGEHGWMNPSRGVVLGSSPRMRGTLVRHLYGLCDGGIIPAYAGNTAWPTLGMP